MKSSFRTAGIALGLLVFFQGCSRAAPPKPLDSAPCQSPPTIDGVIGADEWRDAPVIAFELNMIRLDPVATEKRPCELRVMNSANALYVALKVPDQTIDNSLTPLMLDTAILAFCQGDRVNAHDDRKVIAQGIYRDKYVAAPGKGDDDDARQDGRGVMSREKGVSSFEWAIPLDSGDNDDLRTKPGDSFRFNVTYFDALQLPMTKTRMGGFHGLHLDNADEWGMLRLAANVKNDGGTAFQAPAWVTALGERLKSVSRSRVQVTSAELVPGSSPPTAKVLVSFTYRDPHGNAKEAQAKLFVPELVHTQGYARRPMFFAAGYELPDGVEQHYTGRGWVVVSPHALETNPLVRTMNPDVALLHLARTLPWVEDTRIVIGGGSAGGWMTLLLAAETFPLAGAAPDVPPVNWGYNGAYFFKQLEKAGPDGGKTAKLPAVFAVGSLLKPCLSVYGENYDDSAWFAASPIAQVSTITCPVSVYFSTADMLVPMNQVGARWVQPFEKSQFPDGFTMDPEKLITSREGRLRLLDVLPASAYELFNLAVPAGTARHNSPGTSGNATACELPMSTDKQWSIAIIDEGPPIPTIDHRKFNVGLTRNVFLERVVTGKIAPDQLTATKLERLMDRYVGKEWLPSQLKQLDVPERERADVVRGLRTYVAASPANARQFTELYARLAPGRQVLQAGTVKELERTNPAH
jgi:hypothetical protein